MRKLAIAVALASTALATPALARDKAWYVGVEGGAMIVEDTHFDIGATKDVQQIDHRYGYDVGGTVGYDLGAFRLEAEVAYKSSNVKSIRSSQRIPDYNSNGTLAGGGGAPAGFYSYAGGRDTALSFMVNGMLDFGDEDGVQGFIGGGVGVARVKSKYGLNTYGNYINDSDTVFAYQGIAGVRAPLSRTVDATLKYRFFTADKVRLVDVTGAAYKGRFRSHSIMGGLAFNFGVPTPPPPAPIVEPVPVPPPPPPVEVAPPPPPPCSPGPFIVFFEWDKSDITPEAASILDNAIGQYANCGNASVMVAGYTDTSGSAKYNVGLSQRRADSVKAYMVAHSIPEGQITEQAFGETRLRVETADGVREVQNRRVEINYGPNAGM